MAANDNPNPAPAASTGLRPDILPIPPQEQAGYSVDPNFADTRARTARHLAYFLISLLSAVSLLQYGTLHFLVWSGKTDAVPTFEHLFNALLPVVAGLASSAATYYFTKDK